MADKKTASDIDMTFTGLFDTQGHPIYKARKPYAPETGTFNQRSRQSTRYVISGDQMGAPIDFFGPGEPLFPMGPDGGEGRQFDYPVGYNIRTRPRQEEGVTFEELRLLAEHHDITRLLIETRKDQMCSLEWDIRPKHDDNGNPLEDNGTDADKRADVTRRFFEQPDGFNAFSEWLRMVLEDLLVIDAPTIYVNREDPDSTKFEVIDGGTIKRLLDPRGRTPLSPDPAYQQIIHGLPAWDYSVDDLIYYPRNPRPGFIYGCSPVQQIIISVNIGLRKQMSQLQYYTDGNIPDALIGTPSEWTPSQIIEYQRAWDALHEGNTAMRRRAKFVPGDAKIQQTREVILKDEFDEWLARVACFAFSIAPTAFVKQQNRATAETAKEAAQEEGLAPLMKWTKHFMNIMIQKHLGQHDLEFIWGDITDSDPQIQAEILDKKVRNGTMTINEARAEDGLDPIPGGDVAMIFIGTTPIPVHIAAEQSVVPGEPPEGGPEPDATGEGTAPKKPGSSGPGTASKKPAFKPANTAPKGGQQAQAPAKKPAPVIQQGKPGEEETPPGKTTAKDKQKAEVGGHRHTPFCRPKRY